eukprot:6730331-Pyramimonas_sp.AAC.1
MPTLARDVLDNSCQSRVMMAAGFVANTLPEELPVAVAAFHVGKAHAEQAAKLRDEYRQDPSTPTPEAQIGPA